VQDVSDYASLLTNIRERDLFSSLSALSRIVRSSNSALAEPVQSVIDLYWPAVNILSTIDSGISLSNVTDFYSNILALVSVLENSTLVTKKDLDEATYTNSLYVEKSSNTLSDINKSLNSSVTYYGDMAPVTTLYFSDLLLLETEILKNMDNVKNVNQLIYERSHDLKSKGILSEREVAKYKRVYDQARKVDTAAASNINELLRVNLSLFEEVLS
jgi:hypothetical protein